MLHLSSTVYQPVHNISQYAIYRYPSYPLLYCIVVKNIAIYQNIDLLLHPYNQCLILLALAEAGAMATCSGVVVSH